jgi:hypothetical protein
MFNQAGSILLKTIINMVFKQIFFFILRKISSILLRFHYISYIPHLTILGTPTMQEREAKILFQSNDLQNVIIEQSNSGKPGWHISFVDRNGNNQFLVSKRSSDPRLFKTSDAALRCCSRIGFHQVEVKV